MPHSITAQDEVRSPNEQTIYIPYEKLRDVFEREGRGVFLPYEQFQKLWQEARASNRLPATAIPPVDAVLVSADNTASFESDVMVVRAKLSVELFRSGWLKIPLGLNDAAIQTAQIEGQPARILHDLNSGYSLLVQNLDANPVSKQIDLVYAKAFEKTPGQNSVSIMPPQAPLNQWRIRIPEVGVKVHVEPMLATAQSDRSSETPNNVTEVMAFVGAAPTVRIRWVPKSEGATGMSALSSVQSQNRILIEDGIMRTTTQLTYTVERAELGQIAVSIPANQRVINVFDSNVRKWSVEPSDDFKNPGQKLMVELFEVARQSQNLVIELESVLEGKPDALAIVQPLICLDANRQQGVIAVRIAPGMRAEPIDRKGLMQVDPNELPQAWRKEPWNFAFRFTSVPYESSFKLAKILPTIRVNQRAEVVVEPQSINIELSTAHKIENAGIFQLEFEIPPDYELLQVSGQGGANLEAAAIDAYRFSNANEDRLVVSLSRRAIGNVGTRIHLRKKMADDNLVTPTGNASNIAIPIPRAVGDYIQWLDGLITIHAPESLRINPTEKAGLSENVSPESRNAWPSSRRERYPDAAEAFAFAHAIEPVKVSLDVERRRPFVTVRQLMHALVEPGSIRFMSTLFTKVQYSSVSTLRIDVPETLIRDIRIETSGVRESAITPPPSDVGVGYVAWELSADTPWIGNRTVQLAWTKKLEGLEIGKRVEFDVPRLIPRNSNQSWGQVVINRRDSLDVQSMEGTSGLRPIDPRYDLMPGVSHADAVRAFEYQNDWTLKAAVTRYALEHVKQTS
ncbi:MAG: hypothetical protein ABL921_21500, partial [Pirellula sp.]